MAASGPNDAGRISRSSEPSGRSSDPSGERNRALAGRVAIVTGAASGIGRATAKLFAQEGARVLLADRDAGAGQAVADTITAQGGRAVFEIADVASSSDGRRVVKRAFDEFGALHIVVNCAGVIRRSSVLELDETDWDLVMNVNVKSIFLLAKHAIPVMVESGGGSIVNVASGWGLVGGPRAAAYCASKGAVVLLTKAMAIDHGPQKIRVNCVCPGDIDTPMLRDEARQLGEAEAQFMAGSANRPLGRVGTPEEIARSILFLASESSSYMTGAALVVDGGGLAGG